MKFLANENIPKSVWGELMREEHDVSSIANTSPGANDKTVIEIAQNEDRIILTFDKDFGELVFKKKTNVKGVILLRIAPKSVNFVLERLRDLFSRSEIEFENSFLVVEEDKVRLRRLKR